MLLPPDLWVCPKLDWLDLYLSIRSALPRYMLYAEVSKGDSFFQGLRAYLPNEQV
jgi:hypothetical protein